MPDDVARAELVASLGPGQVLVPPEAMTRYTRDVLGRQGVAAWVARPRTTEEVRHVVRWAYRHRCRFVVQGANTGPVLAGIPDGTGAQGVLSMELCRDRVEVDVADRTVTVSAGVDLAGLNETLAAHGLTFPIDLGANPTIGGMVGANTGGARLIRHGDVRRHVLGLEVVLPDAEATVLPLRRGLRKDNRGPDVKQLFVGSSGTLGVVTAATLSVDPLPCRRATALVAPVGRDGVLELLGLVERRHGDTLTAYEMLGRGTLEAIARHRPASMHWPFRSVEVPEVVVLVELASSEVGAGSRPDLREDLAETLAVAHDGGCAGESWFGRPEDLWALRHMAIDAVMREGQVSAFDLSIARPRLFELRSACAALVAKVAPTSRCADFGHVGDGGLHLVVIWPETMDEATHLHQVHRLEDALYDLVEALSGTCSAEHGIGPENVAGLHRHTPQALWRLQRACKVMCDPLDLLGTVHFDP